MDCDTAKELLPFLDGDSLEADEAIAVRRHLRECVRCNREYASQAAMLRLVSTALTRNERPCSPEFLVNLHARLNRKRESRVIHRLAFSAAAIILFAVGVTLYSLIPSNTQHPASGGIVMENSPAAFEQYVANQYLNADELSTLVDENTEVGDADLLGTFISTHYVDVSVEDVMNMMSTDELEQYFASN